MEKLRNDGFLMQARKWRGGRGVIDII